MNKKYKIPKKGFEAWFYKNFPGSISIKRNILISSIFIMFAISSFLLALVTYDIVDADNSKDFISRIESTKLK